MIHPDDARFFKSVLAVLGLGIFIVMLIFAGPVEALVSAYVVIGAAVLSAFCLRRLARGDQSPRTLQSRQPHEARRLVGLATALLVSLSILALIVFLVSGDIGSASATALSVLVVLGAAALIRHTLAGGT